MKRFTRNTLIALAGASCLAGSLQVAAHLNDKEPMQSYRQSYFALLAMNFGPIGAMVQGDMPWNDDQVKMFAADLAALGTMDVSRAFGPGTDKGTTRAKPEIWENQDDFAAKLKDMRESVAALQVAAGSGDRKLIAEATAEAGGTCKACHDEYKAENYLY